MSSKLREVITWRRALPLALFVGSIVIAMRTSPPEAIVDWVGGELGWARAASAAIVYVAAYSLFATFGALAGEVTLPGGISVKVGAAGSSQETVVEDTLVGRLAEVREASLRSVENYGKVTKQLEDTAKELKTLERHLTRLEARVKGIEARSD